MPPCPTDQGECPRAPQTKVSAAVEELERLGATRYSAATAPPGAARLLLLAPLFAPGGARVAAMRAALGALGVDTSRFVEAADLSAALEAADVRVVRVPVPFALPGAGAAPFAAAGPPRLGPPARRRPCEGGGRAFFCGGWATAFFLQRGRLWYGAHAVRGEGCRGGGATGK